MVRAGSEYGLVLYDLEADGFADTEEREKKVTSRRRRDFSLPRAMTPVGEPIR